MSCHPVIMQACRVARINPFLSLQRCDGALRHNIAVNPARVAIECLHANYTMDVQFCTYFAYSSVQYIMLQRKTELLGIRSVMQVCVCAIRNINYYMRNKSAIFSVYCL